MECGDNAGRIFKKVRRRSEEPPKSEDPIVDEKRMKVDQSNIGKTSWKDKLMGN